MHLKTNTLSLAAATPPRVIRVTLRSRVLLILGAAAVALIATLFAASRYLALDRFLGLEDLQAKETVIAVQADFREEIEKLDRANVDLSVYDATYDSMPKPTSKYLHSVLGDGRDGWLDQQRVNFLLLVDQTGNTVSATGFDLATQAIVNVPEDLQAHVTHADRLLEFHGLRDKIEGLMLLSSGPVLVVSHPIVHTNYAGPARGVLITARLRDRSRSSHAAAAFCAITSGVSTFSRPACSTSTSISASRALTASLSSTRRSRTVNGGGSKDSADHPG